MSEKITKEKCVGCPHEMLCLEFFDQDVPGFLEKLEEMTPQGLKDLSANMESKFPVMEKKTWTKESMDRIQQQATNSFGAAFTAFIDALRDNSLPALSAMDLLFEKINRDDMMLLFLYFTLWDMGTHPLQECNLWDLEIAYTEAIARADLMTPTTMQLYKWIAARATIYAFSKVLDEKRARSEETKLREHAPVN